MSWDGRRHHDLGGLQAGPVETVEHGYQPWERRVDALMMLMTQRKNPYFRVDEIRQAIESLGPQAYDSMRYYEKWMHAIAQILIARGVITIDELGKAMEEDRA